MPPKQVVFVHHNQRNGRLSHENATKAWAYVSRRSWQEKPKQLTIKMWESQENIIDQDEISPPDDQNMIIVPYSKLHQAYASKNCLQHIKSPEDLNLVETTFSNVSGYSYRCTLPSPHRTAETQLKIDKALATLPWMQFSIECGIDSLLSRNYTQAFASFEHAARILKNTLTGSMLENLEGIFSTALPALLYAQSRNAHDVAQLFLKQIGGLAAVSGGPMHPLSVVARNLLGLGMTSELVDGLVQVHWNAQLTTQLYDKLELDGMLFESKCEICGDSFPLQEAEHTYRYLISQFRVSNDCRRFGRQFTTLNMAQLYLKHHKFVEAACTVSDAPDELAEWIEKGWMITIPRTAPLSMMGITWRLFVLAQALAGQGKHESADATFRSSISAGQKYLPLDNPVVIRAHKAYATYLYSQNRNREAEEMERMVDLGLKMYMLTL